MICATEKDGNEMRGGRIGETADGRAGGRAGEGGRGGGGRVGEIEIERWKERMARGEGRGRER